jgi:hypothetical protein
VSTGVHKVSLDEANALLGRIIKTVEKSIKHFEFDVKFNFNFDIG